MFIEGYNSVIITPPFPDGSVVGNPPANVGETRDANLIPGLGRSPRGEMATHSSILAWKIQWMEEPGRLQSMGSQGVGHDWMTSLLLKCLIYSKLPEYILTM